MPGGVRYKDLIGRRLLRTRARSQVSFKTNRRFYAVTGTCGLLEARHTSPDGRPGPSRLPDARGLDRLCCPASSHAVSERGIILTVGGLVGIWDKYLPERSHLQPSGFPINRHDQRWWPAQLGTAGPGTLLVWRVSQHKHRAVRDALLEVLWPTKKKTFPSN